MNRINWTQVAVFAVVVVVVLAVGMVVLGSLWGGYGMMGPGMMGDYRGYDPGGMMRDYGGSLFGWLFPLLMCLFPLGFLALLAVGIVWLVRTASAPRPATPVGKVCPECHAAVQPEWKACPHCGATLESAGE